MTVLFCALGIYSSVGGIQRFNERVVKCLGELGDTFITSASVLVLWDNSQDQQKVAPGVRFLPCGRRKLRMLLRFAWTILRQKPDVILYGHTLLTPLATIAHYLAPHARQVLFVHGVEAWEEPRLFERKIVSRFIHHIVSVSRFTALRMLQAYGLDCSRFMVLPNSVDLAEEEPGKPLGKTRLEGKDRLLTVSRLEDKYKGHHKIISSLKNVLPLFPETHYYVVGHGPLAEELRTQAEADGVAPNVHFLGYVDDWTLNAMYESCDIFVMPSKGEGFGIVFLEAWKHRMPVIGGNQDASSEVIQHDVSGLLVNPDSTEEIGTAIRALLSDRNRRIALGEAGHRSLREKYTQAHFKKRLGEGLMYIVGVENGARQGGSQAAPANGSADAAIRVRR